MKTMFLKNQIFTMLMFALTALAMASCHKDDDTAAPLLKDQLTGTWDITSYKLDGDEYLGLLIQSGSIRFDAITDAEGQFEQEVTFPDEESLSLTGAYSVDNTAGKVHMNYEGEVVIAKVEITQSKYMKWDGNQDGYPLVILATKR